jgi:hypothetical protein
MKYLYLLIRHMFPRKKWELVDTINITMEGYKLPVERKLILKDQFGNIKVKKIKG